MTTEIEQKYILDNHKIEISGNTALFEVPVAAIKKTVTDLFNNKNLSLKMITATDERSENGCFKVWYVFGLSKENSFIIPYIKLVDTVEFPSITNDIHAAWSYEKKIHTFFGLTPIGHPDLRPILLHENWPDNVFPLRKDFDLNTRPKIASGTYVFQKVEGEGIYEIPVGPIHAGIIEPGHFRFSVAGEEIMLLETKLGFTHKGSEKLFESLPLKDTLRLSEKISGDSSFSHSLAFCQALEELSDTDVPKRALYLRVIFAELERLANHFGDIGAIMLDTGYNFGGAQGARLRERIMQINERLTESRFLRGVNTIGGVTKDLDNEAISNLKNDLAAINKDFAEVITAAENSASLLNRLKGTGVLTLESAQEHGATGIAAKAIGIQTDGRIDFPYAAYGDLNFDKIETESSGDVFARFKVRVSEVTASITLIEKALSKMSAGPINNSKTNPTFKKNAVTIAIVEGWRGEIAYFVTTDAKGNISRIAPRDPSFINWVLVGGVGPGNVVPDFPLINKSFNLSYTGYDL